MRLDVWLDVACLYKTRSEAKKACEAGRVDVNDDRARPHRILREGDRIVLNRGGGHLQRLIVLVLAERHVKKADARSFYEDVTPAPTPEEMAMRREDRAYRAAALAAGTPDRRRRRDIRRLKEMG